MPNMWWKCYGYQWLKGSIRKELEPSERSVWVDLLALASLSRRPGHIEYSEGMPYTIEDIHRELVNTPIEIIQTTINKCLQEGRLIQDNYGTFVIAHWEEYQSIPDDKKKPGDFDARDRELWERQKTREFVRKRPDEAMEVLSKDIDAMITRADTRETETK